MVERENFDDSNMRKLCKKQRQQRSREVIGEGWEKSGCVGRPFLWGTCCLETTKKEAEENVEKRLGEGRGIL
jgi:hypothetical protein